VVSADAAGQRRRRLRRQSRHSLTAAPHAVPRPAAVWGALATIYVVWGSTYLGIMVAIETLPPLLMSSARFLVAGAILYSLTVRRGDTRGDRPTARQWTAAAIVGGALLLAGNGGVALSEERIDSGVAALLVATIPLWMAVLDRVLNGRGLAWTGLLGLVVGLGGVALLVGPSGGGGIDLVGALMALSAAFAWAWGSLYARDATLPARPLVGAGMQMLAGGVLLALAGAATGELGEFDLAAVSARSSIAVAYLVVFGSVIAYSAYVWLLKNAPTALVSTYAYVNPVVAVALGALFLAEPVTARMLLAGLAIVASVALIVTSQSAPKRVRRQRPAGSETQEDETQEDRRRRLRRRPQEVRA
jgi:drug/metabolite transporter (DMT)-like permease